MSTKKSRCIAYSLIVILLICISIIYRFEFYKSYSDNNKYLPENLKNKIIVRLWMKDSVLSPTRGYQIEKFNKENKDNIYIMFSEYKEDYYNAIRTTFASEKGAPDIFEYGYTGLMRNKQVASLNDIGFDTSNIDKSTIVKYKNMPLGVKLTETNAKMIWNKEILKESGLDPNKPPETYEQLIDYSLKVKKKFPNITPFVFPFNQYDDMKISIGEPSVNSGTIYTSFWNYNKGIYDFSYSKKILDVYNEMYRLNLIPKDFDQKSRNQIRSEFYQGNIAMMISPFEDKGYFSNIMPLNFPVGIQNIIQTGKEDNIYYYVENQNFLVVNKNSIKSNKEKEAIKKVYEFITSKYVNEEILETRYALPVNLDTTKVKNDIYSEYNDVSKFRNEDYDPTIFLSRDSGYEMGLVADAIKGKDSVNSTIKKLNEKYKYYYKFAVDKEDFDFKYYKK